VTSLDVSDKRMGRVRENLERTGLAAKIIVADALKWEPEAPFDAVLLDAPCTATGTARRHPDVLHRIAPRHIAEMADLQGRLLADAERWVVPGGTLVYAVCSLEREEGEAQAAKVALVADPVRSDELPSGLAPTPEGHVRTDPGMLAEAGGLDGFFIARWRA
jgi:16S rRNA (cytosine967-C5)-methyltransferase